MQRTHNILCISSKNLEWKRKDPSELQTGLNHADSATSLDTAQRSAQHYSDTAMQVCHQEILVK